MTDVNVSYDSEDNIRNDGNDGKSIQPVRRQGSSVEGPPPPPPPHQPSVVVPNLEMEFPSPPRFGLKMIRLARAERCAHSHSYLQCAFLCSSLDDGANNCKTETTQIEADSSLFLEITPPELDGDGKASKVTFLNSCHFLLLHLLIYLNLSI